MGSTAAPRTQAVPVPPRPVGRESIAAAWCRDIAEAVATALGAPFTDAHLRISLHEDLPTPHRLDAVFTTAGHQVCIRVCWPQPWRAPQFRLHVDGREVPVADDPDQRPAAILAHTAWQAIVATGTRTAGTEAR